MIRSIALSTRTGELVVFGRVLTGLNVVVRIGDLPTDAQTQKPLKTVYIESVTVSVT